VKSDPVLNEARTLRKRWLYLRARSSSLKEEATQLLSERKQIAPRLNDKTITPKELQTLRIRKIYLQGRPLEIRDEIKALLEEQRKVAEEFKKAKGRT